MDVFIKIKGFNSQQKYQIKKLFYTVIGDKKNDS